MDHQTVGFRVILADYDVIVLFDRAGRANFNWDVVFLGFIKTLSFASVKLGKKFNKGCNLNLGHRI